MTSSVQWEPYDETTTRMEESMRYHIQSQSREIYTIFSQTNPYFSSCPYALSQLLSNESKGKISSVSSKGKTYNIKPEQLTRRWRTSLECARRTIDKTEQRALRDWTRVQGDRRFRPTQMQLRYPRLKSEVFCDIKFGPCKSFEGNTCLAVYATKFQWARAYPLSKERDAHHSLSHFFRDFGLPEILIFDSALSLTQGEYKRTASKAQVPIKEIEPFHPNQNLAEDTFREGSRLYNRFMTARNIRTALWDRVFMYCLETRSHMALGHPLQNGECGATIIQGHTADISHIADFSMYDWCWTLSPKQSNQHRKQLTRWLGPSFNIGGELCYALLTAKAQVIIRSSVSPLNKEGINSEDIRAMKNEFTQEFSRRLESKQSNTELIETPDKMNYNKYSIVTDDSGPSFIMYEDDEKDDFTASDYTEEEDQIESDKYISFKVRLMEDDMEQVGIIKGRKRGPDGKFIGKYNANPILDTSVYEIEFQDGRVESYFANQIVECILNESEVESNISHHIKDFVDHRKDAKALTKMKLF